MNRVNGKKIQLLDLAVVVLHQAADILIKILAYCHVLKIIITLYFLQI